MGVVFSPHKAQWEFLNAKPTARFRAAIAGVQGGKTLVGCVAIAKVMERSKNDYFMITAPSYKMLKQATKPTFEMVYGRWLTRKDDRNEEAKDVRGNTIFFRSTDNPDSLRGPTLRAALMDEAAYSPKRAWDILRQRVAVKKGYIFITTTPHGNNWLYKHVWLLREDPEYLCVSWSSLENPAFSKEEFEKLKRESDELWFRQEYEAEFLGFGGLVFPEFDYEVHVKEVAVDEGLPVFWGMDFGIANPTFISMWRVIKLSTHEEFKAIFPSFPLKVPHYVYYCFDELWIQGRPLPQVIEYALSRGKRPVWVACDPSGRARDMIVGVGAVDLLREYGLQPVFNKNWNSAKVRIRGINEVHKLLRDTPPQILIHPRC
ncbi:MAG: terminase family protein, partial [Candidatus Caldarchaeum sp.]